MVGGSHDAKYSVEFDTSISYPLDKYFILECVIKGGIKVQSEPFTSGIVDDVTGVDFDFEEVNAEWVEPPTPEEII